MLRASSGSIDESTLTKGQLHKLNALRKSVGQDIGERAFAGFKEAYDLTGLRGGTFQLT